jgi:hypothetical protein
VDADASSPDMNLLGNYILVSHLQRRRCGDEGRRIAKLRAYIALSSQERKDYRQRREKS